MKMEAMAVSSTQTSLFDASAQTTIPRGASFRKWAPWGLALESFSRRLRSSITMNCQGFKPLDDGDRRAASIGASIFSFSTGRFLNFLMLLLVEIRSKNMVLLFSSMKSGNIDIALQVQFIKFFSEKSF